MRLNHITLAALGMVCAAAFANRLSLQAYGEHRISGMFLDARAPDRPPKYSRSEIRRMIQAAKTPEDFQRLADYFDYQSLAFKQKANEQLNELERLLALRYHAKSYPIQVDHTRELLKESRTKADECSARASAYRAHTTENLQTQ
jgi:hypothetical protein